MTHHPLKYPIPVHYDKLSPHDIVEYCLLPVQSHKQYSPLKAAIRLVCYWYRLKTEPFCESVTEMIYLSNFDLDMSVVFNRRHFARKLVGSSWIRSGWLVVSGSRRKCVFYASGISHSSYSFSNSTPSSFLDLVSEYCDSSMLCLRNLFNTVRIASSRS